jgi:hypothetical protein
MDQKSGKAGPMDIVKLEIMHTNQKSEQVLKVTVVLIERK